MSSLALLGDGRAGCRDLGLYGVEVEARALLHRRKLDRRHGQFLDLLLDEHETPEFVFEPVKVLLCSEPGPAIGPARALERIEAQVDQIGHVRLGFITQPASWLVDKTILEVVDA